MTRFHLAAEIIRNTYRVSGPLWTLSMILDKAGLSTLRFWPEKKVMPEILAAQTMTILRCFGMSEEHASITTELMMYADLRGIDSHGCGMLPYYDEALRNGLLTMTPKIEIVRESETTALVDGGGGLGHVPGNFAMKLAIEKCAKNGTGTVAVRNSGHFGAAGAYALMAAQSGFIGIATTNTGIPAVVPTFGLEAMLGTNPIAFAAPASQNQSFLLDMATSTVPVGKITVASRTGRSIPAGWALDSEGMSITNARLAAKYRRLTPLGGSREMGSHKGYGLAAAVEILSSILPGLQKTSNVEGTNNRVGHFFLTMDPARFREKGEFEAGLDGLINSLRNSKSVNTKQPVLVAGDPEHAAYVERSRSGIPLSRSLVEEIRAICKACNVPFTLEMKE